MNCIRSDVEGTAQHEKRKKDRPKTKRKKTSDKQQAPKLTILSLEQEGEVVECQMETAKHAFVSFKFNLEDDQPADIADNLVSYGT